MNYIKQSQNFGENKKGTFADVKEALIDSENFILKGELGIGKVFVVRDFCDQLGLEYKFIDCSIANDLTASVNKAVENGVQVIFIDVVERNSRKDAEVYQIFNREDVKVILNVNTLPNPTVDLEVVFVKLFRSKPVKVIKLSL
jgi:hypothetical protein